MCPPPPVSSAASFTRTYSTSQLFVHVSGDHEPLRSPQHSVLTSMYTSSNWFFGDIHVPEQFTVRCRNRELRYFFETRRAACTPYIALKETERMYRRGHPFLSFDPDSCLALLFCRGGKAVGSRSLRETNCGNRRHKNKYGRFRKNAAAGFVNPVLQLALAGHGTPRPIACSVPAPRSRGHVQIHALLSQKSSGALLLRNSRVVGPFGPGALA